jgi:uncharacterized protein involved in exopolysaccharide biosynthesis
VQDEIDLIEYITVLKKHWKMIAKITGLIAVLVFVISITSQPVFEGRATLLIRSSGLSGSLSQYAGIAGMLGINLPGGGQNSVDDYIQILQSNSVAQQVLVNLDLTHRISGWDDPKLKPVELVDKVRKMLKKPKKDGNFLEIIAEAKDPQLAADLANGFVDAMSFYWSALNITAAKGKIDYINSELPRVEKDLKLAEKKMRLVSGGNSLFLNQSTSLQRDFDIYNSVYTMLRKEYESAKLEASKELPPFSVVDRAEKPIRKARPRVILNTLIGIALGGLFSVFVAFFNEYLKGKNSTALL